MQAYPSGKPQPKIKLTCRIDQQRRPQIEFDQPMQHCFCFSVGILTNALLHTRMVHISDTKNRQYKIQKEERNTIYKWFQIFSISGTFMATCANKKREKCLQAKYKDNKRSTINIQPLGQFNSVIAVDLHMLCVYCLLVLGYRYIAYITKNE